MQVYSGKSPLAMIQIGTSNTASHGITQIIDDFMDLRRDLKKKI